MHVDPLDVTAVNSAASTCQKKGEAGSVTRRTFDNFGPNA